MERSNFYEKYAEKAIKPLEASYPITAQLFKVLGRTTTLLLAGIMASSSFEPLRKIGDFGLRRMLPDEI